MNILLSQGRKERYGIAAFNIASIDILLGVIQAAEILHTPIIIQIAEKRLSSTSFPVIGSAMRKAAECANVPIGLHFDHGATKEKIQQAIDLGFTSVMFDGSGYSLEKNIEKTKLMTEYAHKNGISIEAEIGSVGGSEGSNNIARNATAEEALLFTDSTGVDALAVAIGNAHGFYVTKPILDFTLLESISSRSQIPMVLHGGSGLSDDDYLNCIQRGMCKINIGTSLFETARITSMNKHSDIFSQSLAIQAAIREKAIKYIELFSKGKSQLAIQN